MLGLNRKTIAQALLLALLLATQALVLAHEAGHELSAGSEHCWVCLHGSHFKSAAPAATAPPAASAHRLSLPLADDLAPALRRQATLRARGPPASPGLV
jgi:hypothetical protein